MANLAEKMPDIEMLECWEAYEKLDPEDRLSMSHIELARYSEVEDREAWKRFLSLPVISDFISEEMRIFTQSQTRKLISTAVENDRSTGAAQMISALSKTMEDTGSKNNGQIFIYSYVPLNVNEAVAPNTQVEGRDIFNE